MLRPTRYSCTTSFTDHRHSAMSIYSSEYRDISGNPLRDTAKSDPDSPESSEEESGRETSEGGDGAPSGPNGDQKGADGFPPGPNGGRAESEEEADPDGSPPEPTGAPSSSNRAETGPSGAPSGADGVPSRASGEARTNGEGTEGDEEAPHPRIPSGRKRRVKITLKDWSALERVSRILGVGHANVYRIALQHLRRSLDDEGLDAVG